MQCAVLTENSSCALHAGMREEKKGKFSFNIGGTASNYEKVYMHPGMFIPLVAGCIILLNSCPVHRQRSVSRHRRL